MPVLISRGNGSNHTSVRAFSLVPACCCHMNKLPGRQAARILYRAAYVSSVALCALSTEPSAKLGTQGNGVVPGAWLELEDLGEAAIVEPHLPLAPPRPLPRLLHLDLSSFRIPLLSSRPHRITQPTAPRRSLTRASCSVPVGEGRGWRGRRRRRSVGSAERRRRWRGRGGR